MVFECCSTTQAPKLMKMVRRGIWTVVNEQKVQTSSYELQVMSGSTSGRCAGARISYAGGRCHHLVHNTRSHLLYKIIRVVASHQRGQSGHCDRYFCHVNLAGWKIAVEKRLIDLMLVCAERHKLAHAEPTLTWHSTVDWRGRNLGRNVTTVRDR